MPYVVNDDDFSKMMVEIQVNNEIGKDILIQLNKSSNIMLFMVILEVVCIAVMLFEWRFPHIVQSWCMPPSSSRSKPSEDLKTSLVTSGNV